MNEVSSFTSSSSSSSPSHSPTIPSSSSIASVPNINTGNSNNKNKNNHGHPSHHDRTSSRRSHYRKRKKKKINNDDDNGSSLLVHPQNQQQRTKTKTNHPIIFCDMDGVLVDFDGGICKLTNGKYSTADDIPSIKELWNLVKSKRNFFEYLEWTNDGKELWDSIKHLNPTLLTGVPNQQTRSVGIQKANWCRREILENSANCKNKRINHIDKAAHQAYQRHQTVNNNRWKPNTINVISCWTKFKHHECRHKGSILIDDRYKLKTAWENAGGVFVHHVNTKQTLQTLHDLGILVKQKEEKKEQVVVDAILSKEEEEDVPEEEDTTTMSSELDEKNEFCQTDKMIRKSI